MTNFMATLLFIGVLGLLAAAFSRPVADLLAPSRVQLAALVAVLATLSSLYFSGVEDLIPCRYCWWQRIFMYPMAVILPIGLVRRDRNVRLYALPLALIGLAVSARHVWVQQFPDDGGSCEISAPCSVKLVDAYGFLSIPMMTGLSFGLIIALLAADLLADRRSISVTDADSTVEVTR